MIFCRSVSACSRTQRGAVRVISSISAAQVGVTVSCGGGTGSSGCGMAGLSELNSARSPNPRSSCASRFRSSASVAQAVSSMDKHNAKRVRIIFPVCLKFSQSASTISQTQKPSFVGAKLGSMFRIGGSRQAGSRSLATQSVHCPGGRTASATRRSTQMTSNATGACCQRRIGGSTPSPAQYWTGRCLRRQLLFSQATQTRHAVHPGHGRRRSPRRYLARIWRCRLCQR